MKTICIVMGLNQRCLPQTSFNRILALLLCCKMKDKCGCFAQQYCVIGTMQIQLCNMTLVCINDV